MDEHYLDERGIYYRTNASRPDRPTLVFIHGLSGSSSAWRPYEEELRDEYNLITFDLRGHGRSLKRRRYDAYEIGHFVNDLYALLSHLGLKDFILISHSFGALIALEFLTKHQEMVKRAVFLSPGFSPGKEKGAKLIAPLLKLVPALDILPFKERTAGHVDYTKFPGSGDWNLRRMLADVPNTSLRVYLYCTRQSFKIEKKDFLEHITIPVLIMHGKKDSIFPVSNSLVMKEKIKGSRLILLENTDHIIVLNNVAEILAALRAFTEG